MINTLIQTNNEAYSQLFLARAYRDGRGVTKDKNVSIDYFIKAYNNGIQYCEHELLAQLFYSNQDNHKATLIEWITITHKESGYSSYWLGRMITSKQLQSEIDPATCFKKSIDLCDGLGVVELWELVHDSANPLEITNLVEIMIKRAKKGDTAAMYHLGNHYISEKNIEQARYWLNKACEKGHSDSKAILDSINSMNIKKEY